MARLITPSVKALGDKDLETDGNGQQGKAIYKVLKAESRKSLGGK
jgi:hypothetical protein